MSHRLHSMAKDKVGQQVSQDFSFDCKVYIYVYTQMCLHVCACKGICLYINSWPNLSFDCKVCMHVYTHVCVWICIQICVRVCVCTKEHIYRCWVRLFKYYWGISTYTYPNVLFDCKEGIHICIHSCVFMWECMNIFVYEQMQHDFLFVRKVCKFVYTYMCMRVCMHERIHISARDSIFFSRLQGIYLYTHIFICMCVGIYSYTCTHTFCYVCV